MVDGDRVVVIPHLDPDRKALDANRRSPVELELQQADAEIFARIHDAGQLARAAHLEIA